jgi:hypothetical protein
VFQSIAANDIDFLAVRPNFFTVKDSWRSNNTDKVPHVSLNTPYIDRLQSLVLDDKYMDRTVFENLTRSECQARYLTQKFITDAGVGFGVVDPSIHDGPWLGVSGSLIANEEGIGGVLSRSMDGVFGGPDHVHLSCKSCLSSSFSWEDQRALLRAANQFEVYVYAF